jgi:hypothetical protein
MLREGVNNEIRSLVEGWCDRREYHALAGVLPCWVGNNGLTDGWANLAFALRRASNDQRLPSAEREMLKQWWVEIDAAIHGR